MIEPLEDRFLLSADGFIKAAGTVLRDGHGAGDVVLLQGTNLGGWLLKEGWMTPMDSSGASPDDYTARQTLITRFGAVTADSLIDAYENSWITLNDLDNIKAMGMNVIRLPFWYRNLQEEDGTWRADRFERMDWLVSNAWARGIYTILDFHGVVGGQSTADHTGRVRATAEFWTNPTYQQRTIDIWTAIAAHFKDNPGVAAYDLINEPGGTPSSTTLWNMYDRMYDAIRAVDPDHLITMEGTYGSWNWSMLPNPANYGWTNVMYQMHEYQFNSTSDPAAIKAGTDNQVADFNAHKSWNVPAYVGEFNDFSPASDPAGPWIYTVQQYQNAGINWSEWSYKSSNGSGTNSWGIYNRLSPTPTVPNLQTDTSAAISTAWSNWRTDNAARVNTLLLSPLTVQLGPLPTGFTDTDINAPGVAGAASFDASRGTWTLWGGGADIVATADQFNFASKSFTGDGSIVARVSAQSNTDPWSKVGVMLRDSTAAGAMYAAVLATPGNGVTFQWRNATNGTSAETHITGLKAPVWVRLTRSANTFTAYYGSNGTTWTQIGTPQTIALPTTARAGLAASAHNNAQLTTATFTNFSLLPTGWTSQDVFPNTVPPGWAAFDSPANVWTIAGGAATPASTGEGYTFASRSWSGDGFIKANLTSFTNTSNSSRAGLMYNSFPGDSSAPFANVYLTPDDQVGFRWRSIQGDAVSNTQVPAGGAKWVRLIRTGNNISAFFSPDNLHWTRIGFAQTITMPTAVQAGFAVTSADSTKLSQATFTSTIISPKLNISIAGTSADDNYYLQRSGSNIQIWRNSDASGAPAQIVNVDEAASISLDGGAGNDTITLDYSGGDPLLSLGSGSNNLTGGLSGTDVLRVLGLANSANLILQPPYLQTNTVYAPLGSIDRFEIGVDQLATLALNDSTHAVLTGPGNTFQAPNFSMSVVAQLDIGTKDLLISNWDLSKVENRVASARNSGFSGRWTGPGITSSNAAADSLKTVAVLSEGAGVRVKLTALGDLDGNGTVNADDYAKIDAGFANQSTGYANGDLDYSGSINSDDFFFMDLGFSNQNPTPAPADASIATKDRKKHRHARHHKRQINPPSSLPLAASRFHQ